MDDALVLILSGLRKLKVHVDDEIEREASVLAEKLAFLLSTGRFNYFRKKICNGWTDFEKLAGDAFEIHFAYKFESKKKVLQSEAPLIDDSNTTVDFQYTTNGRKLNFELLHISERKWIKEEMKKPSWSIALSDNLAEADKKKSPFAESKYVQDKIRDKIQIPQSGKVIPQKFSTPDADNVNVIVADVTHVHMGMFDIHDAIEIVAGAEYVEPQYRQGIFGLASNLTEKHPRHLVDAHAANRLFRERVHFVLFAWDNKKSNRHLDCDYRFYVVQNFNLVNDDLYNNFFSELESVFSNGEQS